MYATYEYFVNMTNDLSEPASITHISTADVIAFYDAHPCVEYIKEKHRNMHIFSFKKVNSQDVMEKLRGLHVGKACGNDLISAKLIKLGKDALCCSLATIINQCLTVSLFPEQFKCAVVVPLHKKDDVLRKENFGQSVF